MSTSSAVERTELEPVFAYIDQHAEPFAERLRDLCRQPSVSAQNLGLEATFETVQAILQLLRTHLDRHGFADVQVEEVEGEGERAARTDPDAPIAKVVDTALELYGTEPLVLPNMAGLGVAPLWPYLRPAPAARRAEAAPTLPHNE
jgi:acetylornithine deacetylase/succinyl-diaminopimelate desuccinylase-like protein